MNLLSRIGLLQGAWSDADFRFFIAVNQFSLGLISGAIFMAGVSGWLGALYCLIMGKKRRNSPWTVADDILIPFLFLILWFIGMAPYFLVTFLVKAIR